VREAQDATGLRVYTPGELQEGALVGRIMAPRPAAARAGRAGGTAARPYEMRPPIRAANGRAPAVNGHAPASNGADAAPPRDRRTSASNGARSTAGPVAGVAHLDDSLGLAAAKLLTMANEPGAPVGATSVETRGSGRSRPGKRRRARTRSFETMMHDLDEGRDAQAIHTARPEAGASAAAGVRDVVHAVLGLDAGHGLHAAELRRLGAELRACAHAFMVARVADRTALPDGPGATADVGITALAPAGAAAPARDIDDDDDNGVEERAARKPVTVSDDDDDDAVEMPLPPRPRSAPRRPRVAAGPAKWSDPVE
jgi:hypothetical protein